MTMQTKNVIDTAMISTGLTVGLQNIEEIVGMILICIQLIWIFFKVITKISEHIKNKNTNGIQQALEELKKDIENIQTINGEELKKKTKDVIKYE